MIVASSGQIATKTGHDDENRPLHALVQARRERLTADKTARIEALAVFVSMPTPQ